jgi:leucyl aminopeptidase
MIVTVDSSNLIAAKVDLLALPMAQIDPDDGHVPPRLPPRLAAVDRAVGGRLSDAVRSGDFRGKPNQSLLVYPGGGVAAGRLLLVGLGEAGALDTDAFRRAAGVAVSEAVRRKARQVAIAVPRARGVKLPVAARAMAEGAVLAGYRFDTYRSQRPKKNESLAGVALSFERAADTRPARAAAKAGVAIAESQNVARQLSNEPPNALPPLALAREAARVAKEVGLRCRVLDVAEMRRRKMGAILAVGQGSTHPPRLVVLEHNAPGGRGKARRGPLPTICLVGKGITFDSGGISIKPSAAMDEMKHDMSGAATVVGALRACALLKLPLHVVGVIGAAENLPSGTAYRPGDIVTSMSKKTIEILNTDAEGRVVLADALHFANTEFAPVAMVDVATLTGACVVALGSHATGLFGTDDRLVEHLRRAGEATAERVWPMPVWEGHRKAVESTVADVKNVAGREASSSTAAAFLAAFAGKTPWAHLDIAGTGWTGKSAPYQPRGATGVGVRLLVETLQTWKESRIV